MAAYSIPEHVSDPDQYEADQLLLDQVRSGAWLDQQELPPLQYAVPEILPEGYAVLIGPPKVGKSWLVLDLLLAVATGGLALGGIPIRGPRPVFYLALEDGHRRMQSRMRAVLPDESLPKIFDYLCYAKPGQELHTIAAWLRCNRAGALVVLDTLGRVMPNTSSQQDSYKRDYDLGTLLKRMIDAHPGAALVAVHHSRKAQSNDFIDAASGTLAITGAADTVLVLQRPRHSEDSLLSISGREVRESEMALRLLDGKRWQLAGGGVESARHAAAQVRMQAATSSLGDSMQTILRQVQQSEVPVSPAQLVTSTGLPRSTVDVYLGRLVRDGLLDRAGRGHYLASMGAVRSVRVRNPEAASNKQTQLTPTPDAVVTDQEVWA